MDREAPSPPSHLPLVRFAALQSFVCGREAGLSGFPLPRFLAISGGKLGVFRRSPSPKSLARLGFILSYASLLYRVLPLPVCSVPESTERLPWGCGPSSRHQPTASELQASYRPPPCRPRRFTRPRRFPPRLALWVYFTPLPRPGFTLQGLAPRPQPLRLSASACPLVVVPTPLKVVAHLLHFVGPRPQGFSPRPNP